MSCGDSNPGDQLKASWITAAKFFQEMFPLVKNLPVRYLDSGGYAAGGNFRPVKMVAALVCRLGEANQIGGYGGQRVRLGAETS